MLDSLTFFKLKKIPPLRHLALFQLLKNTERKNSLIVQLEQFLQAKHIHLTQYTNIQNLRQGIAWEGPLILLSRPEVPTLLPPTVQNMFASLDTSFKCNLCYDTILCLVLSFNIVSVIFIHIAVCVFTHSFLLPWVSLFA